MKTTAAVPECKTSALKDIAENADCIGGYAYQIIRQQAKRTFKLRSAVLSDGDPENLHQMRIGTRRLRAALTLFEDIIDLSDQPNSPSVDAMQGSLSKLTKTLGKVRDIDVMQAWFTQQLSQHASKADKKSSVRLSKKEQKVIKGLAKSLKKRRKKQFSKLSAALDSREYKSLKKHFKHWLKQPRFSPAAKDSAIVSATERIVPPLLQLLQQPGWTLATQQSAQQHRPTADITLEQLNQQLTSDGPLLHDLRKQIKHIRYQTEFFRGLYGITYASQVREFRTLQKVLGAIQDQLVIDEFLTAELGETWTDKLPTVHRQFQSARLSLWHQWQPLQHKYLQLADRHSPTSKAA